MGGVEGGARAKKVRVVNAPFRRVKVEDATFADPRLKDNSFQARVSGLSLFSVGIGGIVGRWLTMNFALLCFA